MGKRELTSRFRDTWAKKKERKTRLGRGYNLAIAREKKEKRNT